MPRANLTAKVIGSGEWPDSRAEQRAYWLSRSPAERIEAGRAFHERICRWFHLRGRSPASAPLTVRPRE